jgi:hypothetical protein
LPITVRVINDLVPFFQNVGKKYKGDQGNFRVFQKNSPLSYVTGCENFVYFWIIFQTKKFSRKMDLTRQTESEPIISYDYYTPPESAEIDESEPTFIEEENNIHPPITWLETLFGSPKKGYGISF